MRKKTFFVVTTLILWLSLTDGNIYAQSETPKIELGAQYSLLRLRDFDVTDSGVGARITYNFNNNIGLDGEINFFFPKDRLNVCGSIGQLCRQVINGHRIEGLFGPKIGRRTESVGIFGKIRPGFLRLETIEFLTGVGAPCPPNCAIIKEARFALDVGGVLEFYPSRHLVVRFDLGDTIIRFNSSGQIFQRFGADFTSHNLQFSAGIGARF